MGEKMEYREMLDEIFSISEELKGKASEIEYDGLNMNLKDIAEYIRKISTRVYSLWEDAGGMEDVAEREAV